jgi:hypothetical protein
MNLFGKASSVELMSNINIEIVVDGVRKLAVQSIGLSVMSLVCGLGDEPEE